MDNTNNDTADIEDTECSAQFFGFTPKCFCNGVYNAMAQFISDRLPDMKDDLIQQCDTEEEKQQVTDVIQHISKEINGLIDQYFDKLETYLRHSAFHVPRYISLPENCSTNTMIVGRDLSDVEANLDSKVNKLTQKIATINMSAENLEQEQIKSEKYLENFRKLLEVHPLTEDLMKEAKHIDAIRKCIVDIDYLTLSAGM